MLMVIFGAGASYDSYGEHLSSGVNIPGDDDRPPLAKDLFHSRYGHIAEQCPSSTGLVSRLRSTVGVSGVSVEQALEEIREQEKSIPAIGPQLLALRQYLRLAIEWAQRQWAFTTHGVTNYNALLDILHIWAHQQSERVAVVTFNYDTLLDHACCASFRLNLDEFPRYLSNERFAYFKVHGSTDWWHVVRNVNKDVYESANRLEWTGEYKRGVTDFSVVNGETVVPAIAIPTIHKRNFDLACPEGHIRGLRSLLPKVTRLLIVGWRGAEEHFLKLWPSDGLNLNRIGIVDRTEDDVRAVFGNVKGLRKSMSVELIQYPIGFSGFVGQREAVRGFLA